MKSGYLLAPLAIAMAMAAYAPNASAQPYPPPPPRPVQETVTYGYATVLRVNPAYETYRTTEQQCDDGGYQRVQNDTTGGTIVGAIVGGALGNTIGKGDGRRAATVAGAVAENEFEVGVGVGRAAHVGLDAARVVGIGRIF